MNTRAYVAEFVGTLGLLFVIFLTAQSSRPEIGALGIAIAVSFYVAAFGTAMGPISGGQFNPAVTVGLWLAKKMPTKEVAGYLVSQCLGGVVGVFLAASVFGEGSASIRSTIKIGHPSGVTMVGAVTAEIVVTFFFILVVLMTAADKRNPKMGALYIGVVLGAGILAIGPVSGAAINPAVGLALSVGSSSWENVATWLAGPLVGAALAAVLYTGLFQKGESD